MMEIPLTVGRHLGGLLDVSILCYITELSLQQIM
jgi:hypothetical protein